MEIQFPALADSVLRYRHPGRYIYLYLTLVDLQQTESGGDTIQGRADRKDGRRPREDEESRYSPLDRKGPIAIDPELDVNCYRKLCHENHFPPFRYQGNTALTLQITVVQVILD